MADARTKVDSALIKSSFEEYFAEYVLKQKDANAVIADQERAIFAQSEQIDGLSIIKAGPPEVFHPSIRECYSQYNHQGSLADITHTYYSVILSQEDGRPKDRRILIPGGELGTNVIGKLNKQHQYFRLYDGGIIYIEQFDIPSYVKLSDPETIISPTRLNIPIARLVTVSLIDPVDENQTLFRKARVQPELLIHKIYVMNKKAAANLFSDDDIHVEECDDQSLEQVEEKKRQMLLPFIMYATLNSFNNQSRSQQIAMPEFNKKIEWNKVLGYGLRLLSSKPAATYLDHMKDNELCLYMAGKKLAYLVKDNDKSDEAHVNKNELGITEFNSLTSLIKNQQNRKELLYANDSKLDVESKNAIRKLFHITLKRGHTQATYKDLRFLFFMPRWMELYNSLIDINWDTFAADIVAKRFAIHYEIAEELIPVPLPSVKQEEITAVKNLVNKFNIQCSISGCDLFLMSNPNDNNYEESEKEKLIKYNNEQIAKAVLDITSNQGDTLSTVQAFLKLQIGLNRTLNDINNLKNTIQFILQEIVIPKVKLIENDDISVELSNLNSYLYNLCTGPNKEQENLKQAGYFLYKAVLNITQNQKNISINEIGNLHMFLRLTINLIEYLALQRVNTKECGLRLMPNKPGATYCNQLKDNELCLYLTGGKLTYLIRNNAKTYEAFFNENELNITEINSLASLIKNHQNHKELLYANDTKLDTESKNAIGKLLDLTTKRGHTLSKWNDDYCRNQIEGYEAFLKQFAGQYQAPVELAKVATGTGTVVAALSSGAVAIAEGFIAVPVVSSLFAGIGLTLFGPLAVVGGVAAIAGGFVLSKAAKGQIMEPGEMVVHEAKQCLNEYKRQKKTF